jgi:hypothetical protein
MIQRIAGEMLFFSIQAAKVVFLLPRGSCRFSPTCSEYAREAVQNMAPQEAALAIVRRILRCHPFSRGGVDPVQKR